MKVTRTKPVPKAVKPIVIKTEYKGSEDPAFFIHHNRTHRSASEAFRDADYATAFWREKSDWDDFVLFCKDGVVVFPMLFVFVAVIFYVVR